MGLKQILIDARARVENEMNTAINTAVASVIASDVQPKLVELETSKSAAIKEKTDEINSQIQTLRAQLAAAITALNEQCEKAKVDYKDQKVAEVTEKAKVAYTIQLSKLDEQINCLDDNF